MGNLSYTYDLEHNDTLEKMSYIFHLEHTNTIGKLLKISFNT